MQVKTNISKLNMKLKTCNKIYFVGIGGIGMSALAIYYLNKGFSVAGYDKTLSKITQQLKGCGAQITNVDNPKSIPDDFLILEKTLLVYTPAINKDNAILNKFKKLGFELYKRADILGEISKQNFCFAIAGTHGKTTTSTMLGHILKDNNVEATSFLGGISVNYKSNLIPGKSDICVVEADEFDRSFLKLSPNYACITTIDADHLDIYQNKKEFKSAFKEFASKTAGQIFVRKGVPIKGKTFAIDEKADYVAHNLRIKNNKSLFDVTTPSGNIKQIELALPGKHNINNALAALAMANLYGISLNKIAKSLKSFKGIERRFTYKINTNKLVVIDDYAHHPTEINAVYKAVKQLYSSDKILAVFQPHLFSRTQNFADDFAKSLAQFDQLLLLDIYPARELPIKGITSAWLLEKIKLLNIKNKHNYNLVDKNKLLNKIKLSSARVILFMGAGDIANLVDPVVQSLKK